MNDKQKLIWFACNGLYESVHIGCPTFDITIDVMHDERTWFIIKYVIEKRAQKGIDDIIINSLKGVV